MAVSVSSSHPPRNAPPLLYSLSILSILTFLYSPSILSFLPPFSLLSSLPSFLLSIPSTTHISPLVPLLPTPSFLRPHAISSIVMQLNKSIARQHSVILTSSITLFHLQLQLQVQLHVNWNIIIKINEAKSLSHPSTRTHTYTYTYTWCKEEW